MTRIQPAAITQARLAAGLSQREVALEMGISRQVISMHEAGVAPLTAAKAVKILSAIHELVSRRKRLDALAESLREGLSEPAEVQP
jgi:transcriptional regulator with XRE-family HTH domain